MIHTLLLFPPLLGFVSTENVVFKRVSLPTNFLSDASIFKANTKIECSAQCNIIMNDDAYTAVGFDESQRNCICGKKRFAPVEFPPAYVDVIHVKTTCKKIKTGEQNILKQSQDIFYDTLKSIFGDNLDSGS